MRRKVATRCNTTCTQGSTSLQVLLNSKSGLRFPAACLSRQSAKPVRNLAKHPAPTGEEAAPYGAFGIAFPSRAPTRVLSSSGR
eukprot:13651831-Alexandrium_andersonii.AAC.1